MCLGKAGGEDQRPRGPGADCWVLSEVGLQSSTCVLGGQKGRRHSRGSLGQGGSELRRQQGRVLLRAEPTGSVLSPAGKPLSFRKVCTSFGSCLSEIHNMCSLH